MSLVHEALQKAEREKQRKAGVWPAPAQKSPPKPVQQLGATEPLPATGGRPAGTGSPVASAALSSVTDHAAGGAGPTTASRSADRIAAGLDPKKKQSRLLPALIVCVSLVAFVAIVFLVSLTASTILQTSQTVRAGGEARPATAANESAPQPVAATPERRVGANAAVGVTAQQPPAPPAGSTGATAGQPLAPPAGSVVAGYRLTGIMILPDGKYAAVLNGRVAYESGDVGGATVKKIERDRVTLVDGQGKEVLLRLN